MIEWKITIDLDPKSKATSYRTYWHDHMQLKLHGLFYLEFAKHKLPHFLLWEPTQRIKSLAVVDLLVTTLDLPILMVWE